ncbi:sulfotransferase family protein [Truepera radiovictrix]|uniref:Sulfotransferase n=1 Tax=Truepera radiovictrix (strain DSM 17093 / CIP 108686 / LMG 22925 / RQ-24) TaxID=649638 RepID=D7CTE7_TRURR|nr:sulfotransferase [Truepera radiovictrix]ADI13804.1 sulfotransferase [Truepera radiovictrix DSM 17093]WMT57631.1 sulfotransferase [Truepera radiovictrix]
MLPNLIILGAMKSGTTSLHEYLSYHPEIFMSRRKELNFFVEHQEWRRGVDWYASHFGGSEGATVRGESSPNYTRHPLFPGVPERMHALLPEAKLIYCVRDPIKRFVSHYLHSYSLGAEDRSLEEVAALTDTPYLLCSLYSFQLERFLEFYPPTQIKVVVLEELQRRPQETLRSVFAFLGVDPSYEDARFAVPSRTMPPVAVRRRGPLKRWLVRRNKRGVYWIERNLPWLFGPPIGLPALSAELRQRLAEAFAEDTDRLRRWTGYDLASWGTSADAASDGRDAEARCARQFAG